MLNVAIVGIGTISKFHLDGLLNFPERCRVVALCDIYPEKAEKVKAQRGLNCFVFDDYRKMLTSGIKIDVVHICNPPFAHAEIAINSMNAGCHVVVEKPMATCLEECDKMLEAEKRNGVTMSCIAQNRFRNSIYRLKKTYDSGLAGKINHFNIKSYWWRGYSYYDLWWRGLWEKEGGGPVMNHTVHHIDQLNWIKGELPIEVMAMLANTMHDNSEVEDLAVAILRYKDGCLGQVTSSVVHHGEEQGLELQCADAKLSAPWLVKAEISQKNGFPVVGRNQELEQKLNAFYESIPNLKYEEYAGEIDNIYTALEQNISPLITGVDGRRTVELITAIYKAGFTGQIVKLPLEKEDPYYTFRGILDNVIHFNHKENAVENFAPEEINLGNY